MNHCARIGLAIDYIEQHLCEPLAVQAIARCSYFSPFHFQRVFQTITGMSVKEYITGRRLHEAVGELRSGKTRILEIALKYQYETHESFSRAFKRRYRMTPRQFRATLPDVVIFERIKVSKRKGTTGETSMEPKIIEKREFKAIGLELRTTTCESKNLHAIPEFWKRFLQEDMASKIPNRTRPNTLLGMCADCADDGSFSYIICAEVDTFDEMPDGMVARSVPAAKYAVFTSIGKIPESIQEAWQYIFSSGLAALGYEHAGTEDFELYDERCTGREDSEVDIYIPIK